MSIKCNLNVSKKIGMGNQPITELSFRKARKEGTSICGFVLPYSSIILFEDKHAISGIQKSILGKKNAKGSDLHLMAKFSKWKTGEVFQKYFAETMIYVLGNST